MDTTRFDDLVRSLVIAPSRRPVLGLLLGGTLGSLVGLTSADARKKKKKKKPCGPCQLKKKGKCKGTQPDGSTCPGGACLAGTCTSPPPAPPPSPPSPPPPPPPPCEGKPDFTECGEGKACSGGVCAMGPPGCYVGSCSGLPLSCCGGVVCVIDCQPLGEGGECNSSSDCQAGLTCVGFVCQAP